MDAMTVLKARHADVRSQWDDRAAHEFDARYIEGLDSRVRAAVSAMERMQELLEKARQECG